MEKQFYIIILLIILIICIFSTVWVLLCKKIIQYYTPQNLFAITIRNNITVNSFGIKGFYFQLSNYSGNVHIKDFNNMISIGSTKQIIFPRNDIYNPIFYNLNSRHDYFTGLVLETNWTPLRPMAFFTGKISWHINNDNNNIKLSLINPNSNNSNIDTYIFNDSNGIRQQLSATTSIYNDTDKQGNIISGISYDIKYDGPVNTIYNPFLCPIGQSQNLITNKCTPFNWIPVFGSSVILNNFDISPIRYYCETLYIVFHNRSDKIFTISNDLSPTDTITYKHQTTSGKDTVQCICFVSQNNSQTNKTYNTNIHFTTDSMPPLLNWGAYLFDLKISKGGCYNFEAHDISATISHDPNLVNLGRVDVQIYNPSWSDHCGAILITYYETPCQNITCGKKPPQYWGPNVPTCTYCGDTTYTSLNCTCNKTCNNNYCTNA
jgi:hypothetical protein